MLTDYVEGMEEEFDIGTEIDTWETGDELWDKAKWWLAHDEERQAAGRAAHGGTLRDTLGVRLTQSATELGRLRPMLPRCQRGLGRAGTRAGAWPRR